MNTNDPAYFGREQTEVKHHILQRYLIALALIVGRIYNDIVYIDCCSGPWNTARSDFADSSFHIAIEQLRKACDLLRQEGRLVSFRCMFIEKDAAAYAKLKAFCEEIHDIVVKPLPGDFVQRIPDVLKFVGDRSDSFPFFFIDPTGWTPLVVEPLKPLLLTTPGEVLINFMTSHIRRWLEVDGKDFDSIIGIEAMNEVRNLSGIDRDDAAVFAYAKLIQREGFFPYIGTTIVLNPQRDQTHFHLIYATRHPKGMEVFKQTERSAARFMSDVRLGAQQRHRIETTGQRELFEASADGNDRHIDRLRVRYLDQARRAVEQELCRRKGHPVLYDEIWQLSCRFPFVWESDLHGWIREIWKDKIVVLGMKPNQRVPKCEWGNQLMWGA